MSRYKSHSVRQDSLKTAPALCELQALAMEQVKQPPPNSGIEHCVLPPYLPVRGLANAYPETTSEAALRHLIWQAEAYEKSPQLGLKSNGFLSVIVRPPGQRKVLLDRVAYLKWLTSGQRSFDMG